MMFDKFFVVAALFVSVVFFSSGCSGVKDDDSFKCRTFLDCPSGFTCGPENTCIEDPAKNDDIVNTDNEQHDPDIDKNDDAVIPDNNETEDEDLNDNTSVFDEDIVQHDEFDEDFINDDESDFDSVDDDAEKEIDVDETADADELADEDSLIVYDDVIIGTGTGTQWIPIGCRKFKYSRSASLYLSSEIGVSAPVTKLAWFDNTGASTSRPVKVYLKETTDAILIANIWADQITGATEVFSGDISTVYGWNEFTLTTPFNHSGTSNLLVLVEMNNGSFCDDDYPAMRYTPAADMHSAWNSDNVPTGNGSVDGSRPDIKISF